MRFTLKPRSVALPMALSDAFANLRSLVPLQETLRETEFERLTAENCSRRYGRLLCLRRAA